MKKIFLASVAVLAIAGSTAVYAQHRGDDGPGRHHQHMRMNPEDRAAFFDARIAAVKAGLKLNADQDKLWPPLEAAVRDFAKLRIDRANARMDARDMRRDERNARRDDERGQRRDDERSARRNESGRDDARGPERNPVERNPVERLRERADRMGETAAVLKRIAETADPLYKTLDDGQKRRLALLTRMEGRFGLERGGDRRGGREFDRDDRGTRDFDRDDRGPRKDRERDRERDRDRGGPERL